MNRMQTASAGTHLLIAVLIGASAGAALAYPLGSESAALVAWVGTSAAFLLLTWAAIWELDAADTARLALKQDPSRAVRDLVLLLVAAGSLLTVALIIFSARHSGSTRVALGVASVVASWAVVHTVFALKYARLYYGEPAGGINFKQDPEPSYRDFAYLAFTIGMTFQVSDTDVQNTTIRTTVLGHALMAYLFGTVIIAVTINLVAGLST